LWFWRAVLTDFEIDKYIRKDDFEEVVGKNKKSGKSSSDFISSTEIDLSPPATCHSKEVKIVSRSLKTVVSQ